MTVVALAARRPRSASRRRIRAVVRRHALVFRRSPHRWFDVLAPGVDAVLIGTIGVVAAAEGDPGQAGVPYLITGVLLFHVLFQANLSLSTGFLEETWSRNVLNVIATPLREWEFAVGSALFGLVKVGLATAMVVGVSVGFYSFDVTDVLVHVLPVLVLLVVQGWILSFFVIGFVLRFGTGAELLAWVLAFVIWPFSGVFYPVEALPGVLQPVAHLLPTTHAFQAARAVIGGAALPWDEVAVAAVGTAGLGALAAWFVLRMLARFRREGYITRYS